MWAATSSPLYVGFRRQKNWLKNIATYGKAGIIRCSRGCELDVGWLVCWQASNLPPNNLNVALRYKSSSSKSTDKSPRQRRHHHSRANLQKWTESRHNFFICGHYSSKMVTLNHAGRAKPTRIDGRNDDDLGRPPPLNHQHLSLSPSSWHHNHRVG